MGCGTSSPVVVEDVNGQKNQAPTSVAAKLKGCVDLSAEEAASQRAISTEVADSAAEDAAGNGSQNQTRGRRLSVVGRNTQPPQAESAVAGSGESQTDAASGAALAKARSRASRARRLSHLTNSADGQGVPEDVAALAAAEVGSDVLGAPTQPAKPPGSIRTSVDLDVQLTVACMSRAGKEPGFRKTNQDNCFAFEKYISEEQSLFGAMDGHGPNGHLVSGFIKQHLPIMLVNSLASAGADAGVSLSQGFLDVDANLGTSRIDCEFSGSTATVAYLKGKTLTTAWVGDSRGVMAVQGPGDGAPRAVDLTVDHKPMDPIERDRIVKSNGRVERLVDEMGEEMGPHRVWLQSAWIPGLAMSRALGDVLAHQVGVSSEPEVSVTELDSTHKFIILASDGVWEFISSQEAVDIVAQSPTVDDGCRALVDEAHQRWLTEEDGVVDDITAVVVKFTMASQ